MVIYDSSAIYIEAASDLQDKITRIDAVISALITAATTSAASADLTQFSLDDGQVKINSMYRSTGEIFNAIRSFEQIKQLYINQLNGRVFRLTDGKNFRR